MDVDQDAYTPKKQSQVSIEDPITPPQNAISPAKAVVTPAQVSVSVSLPRISPVSVSDVAQPSQMPNASRAGYSVQSAPKPSAPVYKSSSYGCGQIKSKPASVAPSFQQAYFAPTVVTPDSFKPIQKKPVKAKAKTPKNQIAAAKQPAKKQSVAVPVASKQVQFTQQQQALPFAPPANAPPPLTPKEVHFLVEVLSNEFADLLDKLPHYKTAAFTSILANCFQPKLVDAYRQGLEVEMSVLDINEVTWEALRSMIQL
jgi:hypothetical protein